MQDMPVYNYAYAFIFTRNIYLQFIAWYLLDKVIHNLCALEWTAVGGSLVGIGGAVLIPSYFWVLLLTLYFLFTFFFCCSDYPQGAVVAPALNRSPTLGVYLLRITRSEYAAELYD